jgi:hypothetical protein
VVVPEQRHLLLQRTIAVDHAEQPALPCIVDVRSRRERPARGDPCVSGHANERIDRVRHALEVHERFDRIADRHPTIRIELVGTRTKTGAPKQMCDVAIRILGHAARSNRIVR